MQASFGRLQLAEQVRASRPIRLIVLLRFGRLDGFEQREAALGAVDS